MKWNWQQKDWPGFRYDNMVCKAFEEQFLHRSGLLIGAYKHINEDEKDDLTVDLISTEALKTSEIEGELLNRDSIQSSIRRSFGLQTDNRKIPAAERGIAEMMVDLYRNYAKPLTHKTLFSWHQMITSGKARPKRYRTLPDPCRCDANSFRSDS